MKSTELRASKYTPDDNIKIFAGLHGVKSAHDAVLQRFTSALDDYPHIDIVGAWESVLPHLLLYGEWVQNEEVRKSTLRRCLHGRDQSDQLKRFLKQTSADIKAKSGSTSSLCSLEDLIEKVNCQLIKYEHDVIALMEQIPRNLAGSKPNTARERLGVVTNTLQARAIICCY